MISKHFENNPRICLNVHEFVGIVFFCESTTDVAIFQNLINWQVNSSHDLTESISRFFRGIATFQVFVRSKVVNGNPLSPGPFWVDWPKEDFICSLRKQQEQELVDCIIGLYKHHPKICLHVRHDNEYTDGTTLNQYGTWHVKYKFN
jgi:hypothetical protein